jgi:hypothetical protein
MLGGDTLFCRGGKSSFSISQRKYVELKLVYFISGRINALLKSGTPRLNSTYEIAAK